MCGRYQLGISMEAIEDFNEILKQVNNNIQENTLSSYEKKEKDYHPGSEAPLLTKDGLKIMQWGFPLDKKLVFNAREETLFEKAMFKDAAHSRRCLVPCTLFYEWKTEGREKTKYEIKTQDPLFYLAGVYGKVVDEQGVVKDVFAVITKASVREMITIHHREPLVVPKSQIISFLKSEEDITRDFLHYSSPEFIYYPIQGNQQLSLF